jgi:hypothetical protein
MLSYLDGKAPEPQVGDIADINLKKIANFDPAHTLVHRVLNTPSVYVNAKQLNVAWLSRVRCSLPIMSAHALSLSSVLGEALTNPPELPALGATPPGPTSN